MLRFLIIFTLWLYTSLSLAGPRTCVDVFRRAETSSTLSESKKRVTEQSWFQKIDFNREKETLAHGKIISVVPLKEFFDSIKMQLHASTANISIVTFENGSMAIWKPGEPKTAEAGAYELAQLVDYKLVPPTVARILNDDSFTDAVPISIVRSLRGKVGSLQYYVLTPWDLPAIGNFEREKLWAKVPLWQKTERIFFNFVFGQWDLHWGNLLIDNAYSLVQIDNESIRTRQQVRFGDLPFKFITKTKDAFNKNDGNLPFPFDQAVHLDHPDLVDFALHLREFTPASSLEQILQHRLRIGNGAAKAGAIIDEFVRLVSSDASEQILHDFADQHDVFLNATGNLSCKIVVWNGMVWIQGIGFQNYGPLVPSEFPEYLVKKYEALNFEKLRSALPERLFPDVMLYDILERRNQLVRFAKGVYMLSQQ